MPLEAKIDLPKVEVELKQSFLTNNKLLNKWLSHQKKSKGKFIRAQLALAAGELLDLPKNTGWSNTGAGTLPLRKPGMFTWPAMVL